MRRFGDAQFCECSVALMQKYIGLYLSQLMFAVMHSDNHSTTLYCDFFATLPNYSFALQACSVHVAKYELHGIDDTRDTCAVSRYFVLLRYTAVSTISIEVSWVSHNTSAHSHTTRMVTGVLPLQGRGSGTLCLLNCNNVALSDNLNGV